jgi:hypothetical protein
VIASLRPIASSPDCGWFIAGGAVLRALLWHEPRNHVRVGKESDLDIFVYVRGVNEGERAAKATALAKTEL